MDLLIFIIGFLGFIGSVIFLIVSFIRKKSKKTALIGLAVSVVLAFTGLMMGSPEETPEVADEPTQKDEEVIEEVVERQEPEEVPEEKQEESEPEKVTEDENKDEVSQDELEKMSLGIMRESFKGMASVEYKDEYKSFNLFPTDDDLVTELTLLVTGDNSMLEDWEGLVDGILSMSQSLEENLGGGYSINLLNPANTDNVLLVCIDGVVFYNVANDL